MRCQYIYIYISENQKQTLEAQSWILVQQDDKDVISQKNQVTQEWSHKFDTEFNCFGNNSVLSGAPSWTHEEIRWCAMAKGPGINIGASSPLSTLKSDMKFWPFSTPLHIWLTLKAAVHCAFSYSAKVNAFLTSSLLCHLASMQTSGTMLSKLKNWLHLFGINKNDFGGEEQEALSKDMQLTGAADMSKFMAGS